MKHRTWLLAAVAMSVPAAAAAQDARPAAQPYVGVTGAFHDFGVSDEEAGVAIDDNGFVGSLVAGVDVPVGGRVTLGAEGNFGIGTGPIDREYGIAARLGVDTGGARLFAKVGYQWLDVDVGGLVKAPISIPPTVGATIDDFVVGLGADIGGRSGGPAVRIGIDSVSFDTLKPHVGLVYRF